MSAIRSADEARDVFARDLVPGIVDRKYADIQRLVPVGGAEPVVPVGIGGYAKDQQQDRDADIAPHVSRLQARRGPRAGAKLLARGS